MAKRLKLKDVQQQLDQKETELKQQTYIAAAAVSETADPRRQMTAQAQLLQQLQSENVQLREEKTEESELSVQLTRDKLRLQEMLDELKQTDRAIDGLRQSIAQLTEEKRQLEQDKEQLQQQLDERTAELATAQSQIADAVGLAERIVAIKQARTDAGVDVHSPAQLATKPIAGKRKSGEQLESEAKRQRGVESGSTALPEQEDGGDDKCVICLDKQPDVLFQRCHHLVCCSVCAASLPADTLFVHPSPPHHMCSFRRGALCERIRVCASFLSLPSPAAMRLDGFVSRARFRTRASRALDAFESEVDARVLADYRETRAHPQNPYRQPMGLQRLREKINSVAYADDEDCVIDLRTTFERFDDLPGLCAKAHVGCTVHGFQLTDER
jgi:regulator of replication initiation timing